VQLIYMGFEQEQNVRQYIFHRTASGEETRVFVVSTDMALFQRNHIGLQEGPAMCLGALTAELGAVECPQPPPQRRALTDKHIQSYLVSRVVHKKQKPGFKASLPRS